MVNLPQRALMSPHKQKRQFLTWLPYDCAYFENTGDKKGRPLSYLARKWASLCCGDICLGDTKKNI